MFIVTSLKTEKWRPPTLCRKNVWITMKQDKNRIITVKIFRIVIIKLIIIWFYFMNLLQTVWCFRFTWELFNHMDMSTLPVKGCKFIMDISEDSWQSHLLHFWRLRTVVAWVLILNLPYASPTLWPSTPTPRHIKILCFCSFLLIAFNVHVWLF